MQIPLSLEYLFKGLTVFATLVTASIVAGRAGKSPYMALLLLAPGPNVVVIWLFAFCKWPKIDRKI